MNVYSALALSLSKHNTGHLFGVMGEGNMHLIATYVDTFKGDYVPACHEAGAILMASGYAFASRSVGFATVTHGPGLGNALGALISSSRDHSSIVVLAGEASSVRRNRSQKIDQAALIAPTGVGFERVRAPHTALADLDRAVQRAQLERRPIVLSVPVDLGFEEVDDSSQTPEIGPPIRLTSAPDPDAMDQAVGLMATARRPIVLAGLGAAESNAAQSISVLAETLGAPLTTTLPAKGLFGVNDARYIGIFGSLSTEFVARTIAESDCVIAIGASINEYTGGGFDWPYFASPRVIHCDNQPTAFSAEYTSDIQVLADAAAFAQQADEWLKAADHNPSEFGARVMAEHHKIQRQDDRLPAGRLATFLTLVNSALPGDRSIVVDGGRFTTTAIQCMDISRAEAWSCPWRGFGAVGNAVATAVGVSLARPAAPTVAIVGDGGFMLGGVAEFNTAVRLNLNLIVLVCNDGAYGAEYRKLNDWDLSTDTSLFDWPDLASVASALGGEGVTVSHDDEPDLQALFAELDRPLLIDLRLDVASP